MIGHEWAVQLLQEHVAKQRVRHAYLVTGPLGVGRRTLALGLAQALNCPQPKAPGQPCLECSTCRRIREMTYPDLHVVQAELVGGLLKVDQVRELQRSLALTPYEGKYRVAVLLRFEEANPNAANALLKTLEEPNSQVVLVLTAESAEALLPTIVSRCEVLRLHPLTPQVVEKALESQWGLPDEQARLLAHVSDGRPGYALRLHQQPELFEQRQSWLEELTQLLASSRVERFTFADKMAKAKDKEALRSMLLTWLSFWRDVLLAASGAAESGGVACSNLDWLPQVQAQAERLTLAQAQGIVCRVQETMELINRNVNTRLALEVLMLDLPHPMDR